MITALLAVALGAFLTSTFVGLLFVARNPALTHVVNDLTTELTSAREAGDEERYRQLTKEAKRTMLTPPIVLLLPLIGMFMGFRWLLHGRTA